MFRDKKCLFYIFYFYKKNNIAYIANCERSTIVVSMKKCRSVIASDSEAIFDKQQIASSFLLAMTHQNSLDTTLVDVQINYLNINRSVFKLLRIIVSTVFSDISSLSAISL